MDLRSRLSGHNTVRSSINPAVRLPREDKPKAQDGKSPSSEGLAWANPKLNAIKAKVQDVLLERTQDTLDKMTRVEVASLVRNTVAQERDLSLTEQDVVVKTLVNEILGYGPIQPLLDDPDVSEVMINGPERIYVEKSGRLQKVPVQFRSPEHLKATLEKMLAFTGRRIDDASPMVDSRLPDGSRVNAVIHPIAVNGDSITIRKFSKDPFTMAQLTEIGTVSDAMARFLEAAVLGRINIIVSGGTGSGKTTTLNALSAFIPGNERIVTIEDAAELQLQQEHKVTLEARPPNVEGRGEITIRSLVRNALRMRPDRIIVGEVRGGEALDMLQAMNTGHEGSLTTAHANSPRDCLARLETMVLMAGADLPLTAIRQQVSSAIDLIVQQSRMQDGSRRIVQITEVVGMESGTITTQDLFVYQQTGLDENGRVQGSFQPQGIRPHFYDKIIRYGIDLPLSIFGW